jgi:hypothetical protein
METTTQEATASQPSEAPIEPSQAGLAPEGSSVNSLAFDPTSLPEDLANEPSLRSFDDVGKLAKSYVHLVKRLGVPPDQLVRLPSSPDDTGWSEVYERLGRPNEVSGYEINAQDEVTGQYLQEAHKLGLSKVQARQLYDWYTKNQESNIAADRDAWQYQQQNYVQELQKEWGRDYAANTDVARRAFLQLADAETLKLVEETGIGNHPGLVKLMNKVGQLMAEDGLLQNDVGTSGNGGRVDIEGRLSELMASDSPYWDGMHRDHDRYVQEALRLRELLT